jgi:hypothetical protein
MFHMLSFIIYLTLVLGMRQHRRRLRLHIACMIFVVLADTTLVVYLAVARDVLHKAVDKFSPLLGVHISFAVISLILYYWAVFTGYRMLQGHSHLRGRLRNLGRTLLFTRGATFATSLMLLLRT